MTDLNNSENIIPTYIFDPLNPIEGTELEKSEFISKYKNVALNRDEIQIIGTTFSEFNDKSELKFINGQFRIIQKEKTLDVINLNDFFHPIQNFSEYRKNNFVITPKNSINIDSSFLDNTLGDASLIFIKAKYLPESNKDNQILHWSYKGSYNNIMGKLMVLTGAVKNGKIWNGWDINPYNDLPEENKGHMIFTNNTDHNVNLTIIIAN